MMEKKSILVVEQNMNFNEVFVEHLSCLNYNIGNFFESWDKPFQYTRWAKLKNLFHRNILGNKYYIEVLKQNQYDQFCKKCIRDFEKKFPGQFDYCLVFRADKLPEFLINYLKNKARKIVGYQYDGLSVSENILLFKDLFSQVFLFDPYDMSRVETEKFKFSTNYHLSISKSLITKYYLYYLGSWQDMRYENLCHLLKMIEKNELHNKIVLCNESAISDNEDIFVSKSHIPFKEYIEDIKNSTIIIDIKANHHNGLSFRFFEALNLEKKLITNNKSVVHYNFYHPDNIYITDFEDFDGLEEFLQKPYKQVDENIVRMYSLENWIKNIFEIEDYIPIPLPKIID